VAKGIENDTLMRMSEVIQQVTRANAVAALSGPSHAEEVGRDLPTTCVAASADGDMATLVQEVFTAPRFRIYTSHDIVGVEVGGSLKNVIAIAAGACDGLELGDNAKAALITRGMAEISRLGVALGADPLTFAGLSGIGDLIVTCGSRHSRNRSMGERIGKGEKVDDIVGGSLMVFEGVRTTKSAMDLSRKLDVPMPITEQVHAVLFDDADPSEAIDALMTRDPKPERV
jgi:glycerol-3-phosphate dehydrogenase (NAD(P)+)